MQNNTRANVCSGTRSLAAVVADPQLLAGKTAVLLEIPACAPPKTTLGIVTVATVACDTECHSTSWQDSVALASVMPALVLC